MDSYCTWRRGEDYTKGEVKRKDGRTMREKNSEEFAKVNLFGLGQANTAFAKYFIGDSFLNP